MKIASDRLLYPDQWTDEERDEYKRAYLAGEPTTTPNPEHEDTESCRICPVLRDLRHEADAETVKSA